MPVGIVPPMYKMLIEKIQWAIDEVNIQLKETKLIILPELNDISSNWYYNYIQLIIE